MLISKLDQSRDRNVVVSISVTVPKRLGRIRLGLSFGIVIIDKTDAGLNGLCIRDVTLLCDVINMYKNY